MSNKVKLNFIKKDSKITCNIDILDSSLIGKKASISLIAKTTVNDSRGINNTKEYFKEIITLAGTNNSFSFDANEFSIYSYNGSSIDIDIFVILKIDDAIIFDTKIKKEIQIDLGLMPVIKGNARQIIDPHDTFNYIDNLKVIPFINKIFAIGLTFVLVIAVLVNTYVGIHDQTVSESKIYFYSKVDSDGDSQSPILNSLGISGGIAAFIRALLLGQLRKYMSFHLVSFGRPKSRDQIFKVSNIIRGISKTPLENIKFRIVACNYECGQYKRGSGTKTRTVSFQNPIRGLIVYEEKIAFIPDKVPIHNYFKGELNFEEMYDGLYPMFMTGSKHGVKFYWELQLLHDNYVDQEEPGPTHIFSYNYFLKG